MDPLVTFVSLLIGFTAYAKRNKKIRYQIRSLERPTMSRFESFTRSLIYGLVVTVLASILISYALISLGFES
jgi:hypothetical protein